MPHKGVDLRAVVLVEDDDRHHFARRGGAYDERAHQPLVGAGVMERVSVLDAEALDFEAYAVGYVGLQPAAVYVEHLVEAAGDMESQRRRRLDLVCAGYLLVGKPAAVGEGKFEFVAIVLRCCRAQARPYLGQLDASYAVELVGHLLRLLPQLLVVGQVLPLAAAANAEVRAERLDAHRRALDEPHRTPLHVTAVPLDYPYVHHVARHGHRHEDHLLLVSTHGLALGGKCSYVQTLDERVVASFSRHITNTFRQRYGFDGKIVKQSPTNCSHHGMAGRRSSPPLS